MYKKATRLKIRFLHDKGLLFIEDLWDLPLQELNKIAKKIKRELSEMEEEDFLKEKNAADESVKLAFDIVLDVLNTKKEESEKRQDEKKLKEERDKILSILSKKQDAALEDMSEEDLRKKLDELG